MYSISIADIQQIIISTKLGAKLKHFFEIKKYSKRNLLSRSKKRTRRALLFYI